MLNTNTSPESRFDPRWGVIADDLTGATDVAATLVEAGLSANVLLDNRYKLASGAEAMVVTTDSRNDTPKAARRKIDIALRSLSKRNAPIIYKKIDSTCHGNITAELLAVGDAITKKAIFCPANLEQGRNVVDGTLHVHGAAQQHLPTLIKQQGCTEIAMLPRSFSEAQFEEAIRGDCHIIIADAGVGEDMDRLAAASLKRSESLYLAGSAGLARSLAHSLLKLEPNGGLCSGTTDEKLGVAQARRQSSPSNRSEVQTVLFIGSRNPVTQRQVDFLVRERNSVVVDCDRSGAADSEQAISHKKDVVIMVPIHIASETVTRSALSQFIELFRSGRIGAVLLSGGDTAMQFCKAMKPHGINIFGELSPGLAWGEFVGGPTDGVSVCTKPGGFGSDNSLLVAVEFMSKIS